MPERFKVVVPCKALYQCSAFFTHTVSVTFNWVTITSNFTPMYDNVVGSKENY